MEALKISLNEYKDQLSSVNDAILNTTDNSQRESLLALKSELQELVQLTQESLDALTAKEDGPAPKNPANRLDDNDNQNDLDNEYALFMQEMADSGVYQKENEQKELNIECSDHSNIEDELASLLGMKCAVYHTHKWGGEPTLHNAMVSSVVPRQDDDQFNDLQVKVLYTHPTHAEMLPCPFYLDGDCRFDDEQCRFCHGLVVPLSDLKEAIEPDFDSVRVGSRILLKLKPPDNEDISLTKKSTEKYHLWHGAIVRSVDLEKRTCLAKLELGIRTGEKRKSTSDEYYVHFEDIFPLNNSNDDDTDSDDSLSDTDYPESKVIRPEMNDSNELLVQRCLQNNTPAMGEWERHTRGMGSKLMLAMGYVPGSGLGAASDGRTQPVEARLLPTGKSLDQCMAISEKHAEQDPLKVEQRLKRLQQREEERNKRAYEREKERERRNVFNFLNRTLGDKDDEGPSAAAAAVDVKQSSSKDLNIEQFKLTEDTKRIEREIVKLNTTLSKYPPGSNGHRNINLQILERNKELNMLKGKEEQISKEQRHRKDKQKLTIF